MFFLNHLLPISGIPHKKRKDSRRGICQYCGFETTNNIRHESYCSLKPTGQRGQAREGEPQAEDQAGEGEPQGEGQEGEEEFEGEGQAGNGEPQGEGHAEAGELEGENGTGEGEPLKEDQAGHGEPEEESQPGEDRDFTENNVALDIPAGPSPPVFYEVCVPLPTCINESTPVILEEVFFFFESTRGPRT